MGEKQTSSRRGEEHTVISIEGFKTDFRRPYENATGFAHRGSSDRPLSRMRRLESEVSFT